MYGGWVLSDHGLLYMVIVQRMEFFGHETKEIEKTIHLDYREDLDGRH